MIHDGHRERLRERFLTSPESFADHELIELLLCYSITRQNTNDTAHEILNKFGSIKGIFDADIPALITAKGIGESSALFIRIIAEILSRYEKEAHYTQTPLESNSVLCDYLKSLFVGTDNEITYVLGFNNSKKLILCKKIAEGYSCGNVISMREMGLTLLSSNAAAAIIVHNHPNGKAIPSGEDIATTEAIRNTLSSFGITFIDHFIVAGDKCCPITNTSKAQLFGFDFGETK